MIIKGKHAEHRAAETRRIENVRSWEYGQKSLRLVRAWGVGLSSSKLDRSGSEQLEIGSLIVDRDHSGSKLDRSGVEVDRGGLK